MGRGSKIRSLTIDWGVDLEGLAKVACDFTDVQHNLDLSAPILHDHAGPVTKPYTNSPSLLGRRIDLSVRFVARLGRPNEDHGRSGRGRALV